MCNVQSAIDFIRMAGGYYQFNLEGRFHSNWKVRVQSIQFGQLVGPIGGLVRGFA